MSAVETIRIAHDGFEAGLVINLSDYRPGEHVAFGTAPAADTAAPVPAPAPATRKKSGT